MITTAALPDALRDALGQVIANERREWRRERELMEAQSRETIAELRARIVELEARVERAVAERLATVRDGRDGEPGAPGRDADISPLVAEIEKREFAQAERLFQIEREWQERIESRLAAVRDGQDGEKGDKGDRGDPGTLIMTGRGAPKVDGRPGDIYIDVESWEVHQFKS
jgi:hypothetical protein